MPEIVPKEAPDPRSFLGYDGTDFYVLKVDADGHLQIDALEVALPEGAGTAANQATMIAAMLRKATLPVIQNVTMTLADTEYSQALPANVKKFLIKCRTNYPIQVAVREGWSGTTYVTVPAGMSWWEDLIQPASLTLYFQCATAGQEAQIVAWT